MASEVTVYWRPGCPFCTMLTSSLDRPGVSYERRKIWDDPDAAAFVRSVANGDETGPTVTVGETSMINPRAAAVLAVMSA